LASQFPSASTGEPYHGDAVLLRHFDDQGKISGLRTPDFQHYAPLFNRLWLRDSLPERSGG
jgi:predicted HD phosphohydrolase